MWCARDERSAENRSLRGFRRYFDVDGGISGVLQAALWNRFHNELALPAAEGSHADTDRESGGGGARGAHGDCPLTPCGDADARHAARRREQPRMEDHLAGDPRFSMRPGCSGPPGSPSTTPTSRPSSPRMNPGPCSCFELQHRHRSRCAARAPDVRASFQCYVSAGGGGRGPRRRQRLCRLAEVQRDDWRRRLGRPRRAQRTILHDQYNTLRKDETAGRAGSHGV